MRPITLGAVSLLFLTYIVPVFLPGNDPPSLGAPGQDLMARIFPALSPPLLIARLLGLFAAALIIVRSTPRLPALRTFAATDESALTDPTPTEYLALGMAGITIVLALLHSSLTPMWQLGFAIVIPVPALLLWWDGRTAHSRTDLRRPLARLGGFVLAWGILRLWATWRSPRLAASLDGWMHLAEAFRVLESGESLWASSSVPAYSNVSSLFLGVTILNHFDGIPRIPWLQVVNTLWLGLATIWLGYLCLQTVGRHATWIAIAAILAAPVSLFMQLCLIPWGVFFVLQAGLLLFSYEFYRGTSPYALVALATIGGLCSMVGILYVPAVICGCVAIVLVAHRWQRLKPIVLWTAGLCLLSTSWPLLSRPNEILDGIRVHAQDSMGDSTQLELLVTGQRPVALELPADPNDKTKQLDLLVSGALLPFAARRMSVRLVGDVLFEPISTCILAVGLLALLGTARSDRASRALLGFTVVGLAPAALTSALPRLSFYRAIQLVALVPLIIGFGAVTIRTSLRNVRIVNGVVTALVVLILGSGWVIFDHINPRILPASAAALLAEVLDGVPPDRRAMVLDYPGEHGAVGFHALPYADVMRHLPIPPVRTVALSGAASLLGTDGRPAAEIIAWPPSIEADANAAAAVCRLAPGARLLVVFDRPKTSKVVVAVLDPRGWTPSVSTDRLLRFHCDKVGTPAWRSQLGLDRWPPGARVANWNSSE